MQRHHGLILVSFVLAGILAGTAMSADFVVALKRDAGLLTDGAIDARFLTATVVPTTVNDTCLWGMGDARWSNGGALATPDGSGDPNLYKFNFSSIPSNATINLAQLRLYHIGGNGGQGLGGVSPVITHDWIEGAGAVIWSYYPGAAGGASFAHPNGHNTAQGQDANGGNIGPQASWGPNSDSFFSMAVDAGTVTDPISTPTGPGYHVITVTADVQAWVSGAMPNYGWAEMLGYWDMHLSESGSDLQPVLFVDYSSAAHVQPHDGDANNDGVVDVVDLGILARNYDTATGATWAMADFNADGAVDVVDLGTLARNYDWTGTPAGAVPEPATLSLLGLAAMAIIRRKR